MCGGGCGKILGLAASFAIPALAPSFLGVTALSIGESIAVGALTGAVSSALSGGNPLTGALMGGIGGGAGFAFNEAGGFSGMFGGGPGELSMGTVGSGSNAFGSAGFIPGTGGGMSTAMATPGMVAGDVTMGGLDTSLSGNFGSVQNVENMPLLAQGNGSGPGGWDPSASLDNLGGGGYTPGQQMAPTTLGVNADGSTPVLAGSYTGNGAKVGTPGSPTVASGQQEKGWLDGLLSKDSLGRAAVQLGGLMTDNNAPDLGDMNSYLKDLTAMDKQTYDYNVGQQDKKSAVGDKLVANADNMNPDYYGRQYETAAIGQANDSWADQESKLRAQGYDDNYISAMRQKFKVGSTTSAATAYDKGSQAGLNAQNSTYATGGGMYGPVSGPTDRSGSYQQLYSNAKNEDADAGAALENLFQINQKTQKKGSNNTTIG